MKRPPLLILFLFIGSSLLAQDRIVDSLHAILRNEKQDTTKIILLYKISDAYQVSRPDSALMFAQRAYFMAKTKKFIKGESWALNQMAYAYTSLGNFPKALEYYIQQLKIEEKRGYPDNIARVFLNIALLYNTEKDFDKAIIYAKRADSIINVNKFEKLSLYSLIDIGDIYEKKNELDSALYYTKRCYVKCLKDNNQFLIGMTLNNLGNIYAKAGNLNEALVNYKTALPYLKVSTDYNTYIETMLGLAKIFDHDGQNDSAILYAKRSFEVAAGNQFLIKALDATSLLSILYKRKDDIDSAYSYQNSMIVLKDSIENREKIKKVQSITIEEQFRQAEIEHLRNEEKRDRREKLELLAIGISIPAFFLLTIFISRKKVHKRIIESSGIISILLLFEYITLLIHPFVAEKTNHSPFVEIIIFVTIAAVITPSHHKIQDWLMGRLTKMNYNRHHLKNDTENNINEEEISI